MLASELIEKLKNGIAQYGDKPVAIDTTLGPLAIKSITEERGQFVLSEICANTIL